MNNVLLLFWNIQANVGYKERQLLEQKKKQMIQNCISAPKSI